MTDSIAYGLWLLLFATVIIGLKSPLREGGEASSPALTMNSVIVSMFIVYTLISSSLSVIFDRFEFTWVPSLSGSSNAWPILSACNAAAALYVVMYRRFCGHFASTTERNHVKLGLGTFSSVRGLANALCLIGAALKIYVFFALGGAAGVISRMSSGITESFDLALPDGLMNFIINISGIADCAVAWILVSSLKERRGRTLALFLFTAVLSITYLESAKRSLLLEPLLAAALGLHFYVRKLQVRSIPMLLGGAFLFATLTLLVRAVLPATINDVDIDVDAVFWAHGSWIGFYFYSLELATFEAMSVTIYGADYISSLFGGTFAAFYTTNIEPLFYIVPRIMWPAKPEQFIDLSQATTAIVFGLPLDAASWGTAATYIGSSWALGGPLGLVLYTAMLALGSAYFDARFWLRSERGEISSIMLYSLMLYASLVFFRQGSFGFSIILLIPNQLGYIIALVALAGFSALGRKALRPSRESLVG